MSSTPARMSGPLKLITKVFIIESPSASDLAAGIEEGAALSAAFGKSGIQHGLYKVDSTPSFEAALDSIAQEVEKIRKSLGAVTLHLSMHGNNAGIAMTSGEFITWEKLAEIMRNFMHSIKPIVMNNNKLSPVTLCFSSCEGMSAAMINDFVPEDESLFQFVVGPSTPVTWAQAQVAFIAFHQHTLDGGGNGKVALHKMNAAAGLNDVFKGILGRWLKWL